MNLPLLACCKRKSRSVGRELRNRHDSLEVIDPIRLGKASGGQVSFMSDDIAVGVVFGFKTHLQVMRFSPSGNSTSPHPILHQRVILLRNRGCPFLSVDEIVYSFFGQGKDYKKMVPAGFHSRALNSAENNYPTHDKEMLIIINCLKWDSSLDRS